MFGMRFVFKYLANKIPHEPLDEFQLNLQKMMNVPLKEQLTLRVKPVEDSHRIGGRR